MINKEMANQNLSLIITDYGDGHIGEGGRYGIHLSIADSLSPIEMVDMVLLAIQGLSSAVPTLREMLAESLSTSK